jgi:hypothetical protein
MNPDQTATPVTRRVRAYFAPVDRATATPQLFDPAQAGRFSLDAPPAPWTDLGWCTGFKRSNADSGITALRAGSQSFVSAQTRTAADATVELEFSTWGKLQLALSSGSQQMNLLATNVGAAAAASGGDAIPAVALDAASTASDLIVGSATSQFAVGDLVVVDADFSNQTGFVGAGISGAYIRSAAAIQGVDYIRRISLNVGRVAGIVEGTLHLEQPLPAGVPAPGMKLSRVTGFVDREGSSFFQQWSALFVTEGEQGDRILYYYPRLEAMHGARESLSPLAVPLAQVRLAAAFRALPVADPADDENVLCFRSYLPA